MTREDAHIKCLSRDCKCVNGKDRDSNYHETIDKIFDDFEKLSSSKQLVDNHKTCEGCKYYLELIEGASETTCCALHFDCIRKYIPKDRWMSKE